MSAAPDLIEPLLGFRAWHLDPGGALRAWTFESHAWEAGPNRAVCVIHPGHAAPEHGCMCGLYALASPDDHRLRSGGDQAVGAVAGWGAVELHRTGFRAEWACVTALARPPQCSDEAASLLERAAERYGVALVPREALAEEGGRYAKPAPGRAPRRPAAAPAAECWLPGATLRRGIALDEHLWVETTPRGVRIGITPAFAARVGRLDADIALPRAGREVDAFDALTTLGGREGSYDAISPLSGVVIEANPLLERAPEALLEDPVGRGWLLALSPGAWSREHGNVTWGRTCERLYRAHVACERDAFEGISVERRRALPPAGSWADVAAVLRRERARPLFASAADLHERLGGSLRDRLAEAPRVTAALGRLPGDVVLRCSDPRALLRLHAGAAGRASVVAEHASTATPPAAIELRMSAEVAHDLFTGSVDPAVALRTGSLASSADRPTTLTYLSVLAHLRIAPLRRLASWEREEPAAR